jgi:hypothetical protein
MSTIIVVLTASQAIWGEPRLSVSGAYAPRTELRSLLLLSALPGIVLLIEQYKSYPDRITASHTFIIDAQDAVGHSPRGKEDIYIALGWRAVRL